MVTEPPMARWPALALVMMFGLVGLVGVLIPVISYDGVKLFAFLSMGISGLLGAGVTLRVFFSTRVPRQLQPRADGSVKIASPASIFIPLLGLWLLALTWVSLIVWLLFTDPTAIEDDRRLGTFIAAMLFTIPDLIRLITGRLHRWQLILGPDTLTYRGARTNRTLPWSKIQGVRVKPKPAEIIIRTRGSRDPDIKMPFHVFDIPAQQFVDEIETRLKASRPARR